MKLRVVLFTLLALILTTGAWAIGPDVIVGGLGEGGTPNDYQKYDTGGAIIAYSFSTTSCNQGTSDLEWTPGGLHPVIGQNIFRLKDGRFEQLGQAWLKHGFCALHQNFCGLGCAGGGCTPFLGVGCSDPYTASRNAAFGLGPKHNVNAADGSHVHVGGTSGGSGINGRLQVRRNDMDPALNPGALYFAEGQYVHPQDTASGNDDNNASYRRINVSPTLTLSFPEATQRRLPGIFAWDVHDVGVKLEAIDIAGDGRVWVGYKISDNGDGTWHYEYAVQNLNSDRSVGSFTLSMTNPSDTDTDISYLVSGSANAGVDYTTLSGSVTILANQTSATIDVGVIDDLLLEGDETVVVTLNSIVNGNKANYGGGIINWSIGTLTNVTIKDNSAFYSGGGIYNDGTLTLTNSTIKGNSFTRPVSGAGVGGGIYNPAR